MVLTNIFRLDGYEHLRWTILAPEAAERSNRATGALDLVLHAFLKLHKLGHLTAWTVRRNSEPRAAGAQNQTSPVQLWYFRKPSTVPDEVSNKDLLVLLPGFRVVDNGTWTPQSRQPWVTHALSRAIEKKVERAFGKLSYHRFGRVYVRVGGQDLAPKGPLLACEVRLLSNPASLFLQAHISKRNVRLLESSDFTRKQPLTVICSPAGERASLLGSCSPELVARLSRPPPSSILPDADPEAPSNTEGNPYKPRRSKARRRKHASFPASPALHVEVEVEARDGRFARAADFGQQQSAEPRADSQVGGAIGNEVEEEVGRDPGGKLPEGTDDRCRIDGASAEGQSKSKHNGEAEHSIKSDTSGRDSDRRDPDARTWKSRERLILLREQVLVPLPDLGRCASQLRFSMGLEGFGLTGTGGVSTMLGVLGKPSLAGWPTMAEGTEDDRSSSESDSSVDTETEDEAAQGASPDGGVTSDVAGHKRERPVEVGDVKVPPLKVRKLEGATMDLKAFGPFDGVGGAGGGDTWWADDGLDMGLLADFADFGDAFGDAGGFGEVPGSSPRASSRDAVQPLGANSRKLSGGTLTGPQTAIHIPLQDGTPSSATATEADSEEPFKVLLDKFLSQSADTPTQVGREFAESQKAPPVLPKGGSAKAKASGGVDAEEDVRVWLPLEKWAAKVSLPARSETSSEEATRAVYKPEEKMVEFVQAVLGQKGSSTYEALPSGAPGLGHEAAQEVPLRGKYPRVRKVRKGEPSSGKQVGGAQVILEDRGWDPGGELDEPKAKGNGGGLQSGMRGGQAKEHRSSGENSRGRLKRSSSRDSFSPNSVVATDLLLLRREAAKLIEAQGLSPTEGGVIQRGLETGGAKLSGETDRGIDLSGPGNNAVLQQEPLLQLFNEGVSSGRERKSGAAWDVRKQRPLSPLLLQQAVSGRSIFRTSPLEDGEHGLDSSVGTVSAAMVAGILVDDVSIALRDALGSDRISGPLTLDELCQDHHVGGTASGATHPPATQIGSPAIEHPVTPPQLWAITLSPLGGVGGGLKVTPPPENVEAVGAETAQSDLARIRYLGPPPILVGYQEDWLRVPQGVLNHWEKAPLEPYSAPKPVTYTAFCPAAADLLPLCVRYLREVGSVYEACQLGSHVAGSVPADLATPSAPGIVPVVLDPDRTAAMGGESVSGETDWVEVFVEGICNTVTRLGFGGNRREGSEGSDDPCTVVYVVLPLCTEDQARSAAAQLADFFWTSETGAATIRTGIPSSAVSLADTRITLQLLLESELRRTWYRPGAIDRFKRVAFQVYLKARRTTRKLPLGTRLEGLPPTEIVGRTDEVFSGSGDGHLLFEPLVVLADPPPFCPVVLTRPSEKREVGELEAGEHAPASGLPLHCCYAWANDGRTLVSVWTDGAGELLDAYVIREGVGKDSQAEGSDHAYGSGSSGTAFRTGTNPGALMLGLRPPGQGVRLADRAISYSHQRSEALLDGILEQSAKLQGLAAAALPEGDPPRPCHVIITRLGGMPLSESVAWSRLLGSPRQHDIARELTQILPPPDPAMQSAPDVVHPGLGNLSTRGIELRHGRSFSLELGGDPLELERFASLEQQCLSPASPGLVPFGPRVGGITDRAFLSPPDRMGEESHGSIASITIVALEEERSCQLLHGVDDRQGRDNLMSASISARALPHSRNDHLIIPANPLYRLATCGATHEGPEEPLANSVACGYLVGDVAPADDVSFGTSADKDDWRATLRLDLISHFASSGNNVHMQALQDFRPQALNLLESIIDGFHALSWLNVNDGDCRRSLLPMHAAMAEEVVRNVGGLL